MVNHIRMNHALLPLDIFAPITLCRASVVASIFLILVTLTACGPGSAGSGGIAPILLFSGTGTSSGDVAAIETILDSSHLSYTPVNSFQLNWMQESRISGYWLLIVPRALVFPPQLPLLLRQPLRIRRSVTSMLLRCPQTYSLPGFSVKIQVQIEDFKGFLQPYFCRA
jgi:hypothetical protein